MGIWLRAWSHPAAGFKSLLTALQFLPAEFHRPRIAEPLRQNLIACSFIWDPILMRSFAKLRKKQRIARILWRVIPKRWRPDDCSLKITARNATAMTQKADGKLPACAFQKCRT